MVLPDEWQQILSNFFLDIVTLLLDSKGTPEII